MQTKGAEQVLHVDATQVQAQAQAPAQAQAQASAQAQIHEEPAHAQHLAIKRFVIAHGVKDREPVEAATQFSSEGKPRVYAFLEVENKEHAPGAVFVAFEPPPSKVAVPPAEHDVRLAVGPSQRWRTWAFKSAPHEVGTWTAVVKDERGQELARATFDVTL
jgi:hypothetical protein